MRLVLFNFFQFTHATINTGESISKHSQESQPNHIVKQIIEKINFQNSKSIIFLKNQLNSTHKNLKLANKKKIKLSIHNPKFNQKSQNFPQILEARWVGGRGGQRERRLGMRD